MNGIKIKLNWALFAVTAAAYIFYPVWRLPMPWPAQWALLNVFLLISAAALYSPLDGVSFEVPLEELKKLWPVILPAAAVCLPFWLTPLPVGGDDQSHAGPAAWVLGRLTSGLGLNIQLLPAFGLPLAALLAAAAVKAFRKGMKLPGRGTAVLALAAAGNLFFFASLRFGLADAVGKYETLLRYPPLSKFLYLPAYLLLGVHEAAPRAVQFAFMVLTALYALRFLSFLKADPPPRLTYLLIAFFPTFFNLSTSAELEAGTVFFFTAALYHFIKAAATKDREQFLKSSFWIAAGLFYKQLLLGVLLASIPVLALLWLARREDRPVYAYGAKTLALPLLTGMPFLLLSVAYGLLTRSAVSDLGLRGSGLIYSHFTDPAVLTLNLKMLYQTCGAPITALLAAAAGYALYRRRGLELALLVYFSAAYYFMISATGAVGYIRHAQPFYITPVLLLALWAARLPSIAIGRLAIRPAYVLILPLFFFQSVLASDPPQRKTAFNFKKNVFPYRAAAEYFKGLGGRRLKVYAPMEVEPSHFYLARAGLAGRIDWDRDLPPGFSSEAALALTKGRGYDYILLPYSPYPGVRVDLPRIARELEASGLFPERKVFNYGGNELILLKPCAGY